MPRGAVFLSYASQDAEAARRICDALRAAGIEVWFDQSEPLDRLGALSPSASSGPFVLISRETVSLSNGSSNGLGGGDAWDAKIRKQIKECARFVPIVSANTQARAEGYFRLEWKLAADRSHLIARERQAYRFLYGRHPRGYSHQPGQHSRASRGIADLRARISRPEGKLPADREKTRRVLCAGE
jgi:hypothetical protein